jgi:BolA family transcriptional regulator, general stress-responsive regulator
MRQTPLSASQLHSLLAAAMPGAEIKVRNDTHLHADHNAAVNHGGGHYKVRLVWNGFAGLSRLKRQQLVHHALAQAWQTGGIHALSLQCLTPPEAAIPPATGATP